MQASENKWLTVAEDVVLNDAIEEVICLLDPFFEKHELKATVASGVRTYDQQLEIIRKEALKVGLAAVHPDLATMDLNVPIEFGGKLLPAWQLLWSECLVRGAMVNPPTSTPCLFPYKKPDGSPRAAGNVVPTSAHQQGRAFDIGGGQSLDSVVVVVSEGLASHLIDGLKGYLKEPVNHCCHVDVVAS